LEFSEITFFLGAKLGATEGIERVFTHNNVVSGL
jgi:hypothetical protein